MLHEQQSGCTTSVRTSRGALLIPRSKIHNSTMDIVVEVFRGPGGDNEIQMLVKSDVFFLALYCSPNRGKDETGVAYLRGAPLSLCC